MKYYFAFYFSIYFYFLIIKINFKIFSINYQFCIFDILISCSLIISNIYLFILRNLIKF